MKCNICGSTKPHKCYTPKEMMLGLREPFPYFQCSDCGCLQIEKSPSDPSHYYPNNYYSFNTLQENNRLKGYLKKKRNDYAVFETSLIGKLLYRNNPEPAIRSLSYLDVSKSDKILDVGCGNGKLLHSLKKIGFKNLDGVDPFIKEKITYDENLVIRKKEIHDIEGTWDLVMMHHAFEHVPDPLAVLQSIKGLLSDSGKCLLRIPVSDSFALEKFRENWVQLDAPRHNFLHSGISMRLLAEKAGFIITDRVYDSTAFQFWGSIQYEKDIPLHDEKSYAINPSASIFTKSEIKKFIREAEELNQEKKGDQSLFILQKK